MKSVFTLGFFLICYIKLVLAIPSIDLDGNTNRVNGDFRSTNEPKMIYKYDRINEVKKECSSVLPSLDSSSNQKPYGKRFFRIKDKLSFTNGDWWQDLDKAPLMPFDHRLKDGSINGLNGSSDSSSLMNLVSFWVTDVDRAHRSKNSVSINGVMQIGITINGLFGLKPYTDNPGFSIYPGHSELTILFQGIVVDSDDNNGESVMCLLGDTMLPYRYPDSSNPWDWVKEPGYINHPALIQDDRILLVIRYPKKYTLTKRGIYGSMKSLNAKTSQKYFDEVHISSSLSGSANYEFSSENLVAKACTPYPYNDNFVEKGVEMYKGSDFCMILERFTGEDPLTIVPNWKCNGTNEFCSKLGPFESDSSIKMTNGSFKGVRLTFQDVRCEETTSNSKAKKTEKFTKVAAVIRVVSPSEDHYNAAQRSGFDNTTLAAEGIWEGSSGQLCMIGCVGIDCDSRICLYIPLSFSIKQRSIILGTISSLSNNTNNTMNDSSSSYFPLAFEKLIRPSELYDQYTESHPYYTYSKIDIAGTILEKTEPFSFGTVIKKSFLTFPKLENADSSLVGLSLLSEDLTLHHPAVSESTPSTPRSRTDIQLEILSLGELFGHYWSLQNDTVETLSSSSETVTEKQLLLNVSAQLSLSGGQFSNFTNLFVEGLYYPLVGKMYMVGCRDVRASWNVLYESNDLEDGLDCLIEVVVSFPPTTTRWLVNPTARISITSQRNEFDPLFFKPVKLQTVPIMYRAQREDILSRRGVEGLLQVVTLSVAIGCILSQLFYIKENTDAVPYVSLLMLAVQAIGYGLPLVTGAEALFKKTESYDNSSVLEKSEMIKVIDYTVKILVLVSFSLTLRIFQKVWRSRIRLQSRESHSHRVPFEKKIIFVTFLIHVLGFICVLILHKAQSWLVELEEYVGLVQDFFLLPQVIGNLTWQINCKPLRKTYFIGLTIIRLLPHVYDYIRSPIPNPYFSEDYEFVNPHLDFYSKIGDVAIPIFAIFLAVVVHVQQKLSYEKLAAVLDFGKFKVLPRRSVAYERVTTAEAEAEMEMTSGRNGENGRRKDVEIEE